MVWLEPASGAIKAAAFSRRQKPRLDQRNKSFEPHVLVVPVGSVVAFPNHDPFFHNVFSLFEGKRFDSACMKPAAPAMCILTSRESPTSSAIFIPR